jgi:hypothetical protein
MQFTVAYYGSRRCLSFGLQKDNHDISDLSELASFQEFESVMEDKYGSVDYCGSDTEYMLATAEVSEEVEFVTEFRTFITNLGYVCGEITSKEWPEFLG